MYNEIKEPSGYVIKMMKTTIDMNKITFDDMLDMDASDFRIVYYIGKDGRKLMHLPKTSGALFKSYESAVSHRIKYMKNNNDFILTIVPVYAQTNNIKLVRKDEWERQDEDFEMVERARPQRLRIDTFRNYAKDGKKADSKNGRIPKLR